MKPLPKWVVAAVGKAPSLGALGDFHAVNIPDAAITASGGLLPTTIPIRRASTERQTTLSLSLAILVAIPILALALTLFASSHHSANEGDESGYSERAPL